jgi:hypothetical protein
MFCAYCYYTAVCVLKAVRFTASSWPNTTSDDSSLWLLWSFLWLSWICVGPISEILCVNQSEEDRPHPTISVMLWMSWCAVCNCRVGMWGFHVGFQSPLLLLTRWVLGYVSCRTRTWWTTWTHHLHATGSAIFFPVSVCLAFFCPVELQFCTGASPTHEFSSVLALVIGCCYEIHIYVHAACHDWFAYDVVRTGALFQTKFKTDAYIHMHSTLVLWLSTQHCQFKTVSFSWTLLRVFVCMCVYVCVCVYIYIHIYIYICVCVCVYIYIYIHTHLRSL